MKDVKKKKSLKKKLEAKKELQTKKEKYPQLNHIEYQSQETQNIIKPEQNIKKFNAYMYEYKPEIKTKKVKKSKPFVPKPITLPLSPLSLPSSPLVKNKYILLGKKEEKEKDEKKVAEQQIKVYKAPIAPWAKVRLQEYPKIKVIKSKEHEKQKEDINVRELSEILTEKLHKTVMCKNIIKKGKCYIPNCRFAHSEAELRSPKCGYGDACLYKTTTCKFMHPAQTQPQYKERLEEMKEFEKEKKKLEKKKKKEMRKKEMKKELKRLKSIRTPKKKDKEDIEDEIKARWEKMEKIEMEKPKKSRWDVIREVSKDVEKVKQEIKPRKSRWDVVGENMGNIGKDIKLQKRSRWDVTSDDIESQLLILYKITPNVDKLTDEMLRKGNWIVKKEMMNK
jgi:hypothetical protein